jgi:hypothetical protein
LPPISPGAADEDGYLSAEEGERGRIIWAEWPLPESGISKEVLGEDVPEAA